MSAYENFLKAFDYTKFSAELVSFNVFKDNFKFTMLTWIVIIDAITYIFLNMYNVKMFWGDLVTVCFCLVTWSFGFQGIVRISLYIFDKDKILHLMDKSVAAVNAFDRSPELRDTARKYTKYAKLFLCFQFYFFFISGVFAISYPVYTIFVEGELLLPFGFVLPGISYTTHPGFEYNYFYQFIQVWFTVCGLTAAQCCTLLLIIMGCMQLEAVIVKLGLLGDELSLVDQSMGAQNIDMREIFRLHQSGVLFIHQLEQLYSGTFFVDALCIPFQSIIILYVCSVSIWLPGPVLFCAVTFVMFLDCAYGVYIEIKCDDIHDAIMQFPWYTMNIQNQKMIQLMLMQAQHPTVMTFGNLAPLNMDSFVKIYKSIYQYFMILKSVEV